MTISKTASSPAGMSRSLRVISKRCFNLPSPSTAMPCISFLPPTEISRRANVERDFFFMKLGTTFTRKQVREQAAVMGIKENTALIWLKRLVDYGDLVHVDGKGNYMIARARVRA